MDIALLAALLRERRELRGHDRWTRSELSSRQRQLLQDLRGFAFARSPFYREFHRGLAGRPLAELPVLTKATVMERFDDLVTDRDVHLSDVERHLREAEATDLFRGRYRVAATAGTTGRRGVFLSDPDEWATVLASYARAEDWAGVPAGLTHRPRIAVVSTLNPAHQSAIVGATLASRFISTLRLDAARPVGETAAALERFRPEVLVGYASALAQLAEEQLAGRLRIAPRAVMSASEVLTDEMRARLRAAFVSEPFNVYAATETAGIASECGYHRLHLYEDLVIADIVDEDGRPEPVGRSGAKLLVTVLFSRTLPLIRYELSDRVTASADSCPCGRPYALIAGVEGREEEVLELAATAGGMVAVHPNVLHAVLEDVRVEAWQVVQEPSVVRVLLAGPDSGVVDAAVARQVSDALIRVGALDPSVRVERVGSIPRTALGKAPLIRGLREGSVKDALAEGRSVRACRASDAGDPSGLGYTPR